MTLYNLRTVLDDYRITKFTPDLDVESSYLIGAHPPHECGCPAGTRQTCRHRQMLADLLPLVDTQFFWDFEHNMIVDVDGDQVTYLELEEAKAVNDMIQLALQPHSITVNAPDFDSGDGGSTPPAVATPAISWRRI